MELFIPIFNQMLFLLLFIAIGFVLVKCKIVPDNTSKTLSTLENYIFVPGLVLHTFINNCTVETLSAVWKLVALAFAMVILLIPVSLLVSKLCFKERFPSRVAAYGLIFSNFGFMGNAIMNAIFPNVFFEYTVFTLPFWSMIYLWGVPVLLISEDSEKGTVTLTERLKAFVNPMLIAMLIGLVLGLTKLGRYLPSGVRSVIKVSGDCMSPLAMLLTGITIGRANVVAMLKKWRLYWTSLFRLLIYPVVVMLILRLLPQNAFFTPTFFKCAVCVAAMPMGLNAIVVPAAYGKDTSDAAGLALVSHLLSIGTIPLVFMLLQTIVLGG